MLGRSQVGLGVERPQDPLVRRDGGVEPGHEVLEERHAAGALEEGLTVDHGGSDGDVGCRSRAREAALTRRGVDGGSAADGG